MVQRGRNVADSVEIRDALASDAPALSALARASKAHWGYPAAQLEAWAAALEISPACIDAMHVRVACRDGVVLGCYALACESGRCELEHFWVAPHAMGCGVGAALFADARRCAAKLGAREIAIDSDPNAVGFYLRLGARPVGETAAPIEGAPDRVLPRLVVPTPQAVANLVPGCSEAPGRRGFG